MLKHYTFFNLPCACTTKKEEDSITIWHEDVTCSDCKASDIFKAHASERVLVHDGVFSPWFEEKLKKEKKDVSG